MKNIITTLSFLLITTLSFSQSQIQISGQVKDKHSKEYLNYCSVTVLTPKDSIITGAVTNEDGYFFIPVNKGNYKLVLNYIGYKIDTINTVSIYSDKFLGTFSLSPDAKMMNGVTVKTSSRENTIDKDIQIVTDEMRLGTSDTKDLMSKVPGVSLDRYNNAIKVDNSSNIVILADGVEKDADYIQNLSPERIKKIEIIRDPGGRYGLEGYTAIVNVILNKNYVGSELFIYDQSIIDPVPEHENYYLPINRLSVNYNYTKNRVNIYGAVSHNKNSWALNTSSKTIYSNDSVVYENPPLSSPNTFVKNINTKYTLGADFYINPKHTISFESNINNYPESINNTNISTATSILKDNVEVESYGFAFNNKKEFSRSNNSLFYIGKLSNKDKLDASFTYSTYNESYSSQYIQESINNRQEVGNNSNKYTNLNLEYNREVNDKLNFQLGYGNLWKQMDNSFTINDNNKEIYSQTNTRHKLYGYTSYNFNKKLSAKAGIATELSSVVDNNQDNKYTIYQPLLDIKYNLSKNINFKIKYRSESDYPTMAETNPFISAINPRSISMGNPNLKPSVTHKVSLKTNILQGLVSVEPYMHFSNNLIGQTGYLRPDEIFVYTYENIGLFRENGIKTNFTIPFSKKFIWQSSFTVYNSSITHNENTHEVNDWRAESNLIYQGIFNDGLIVLNYQKGLNKRITSLGYNNDNNDFWLLLFQKPFFKKSLNLTIGYVLPIEFAANYSQVGYSKTNDYEKYETADISLLKNLIFLKVTYRLNKGKIKKTEKNIMIEEDNSSGGIL
ncbi:MAG: TonB-dependent receptor [Bacteroidota bacterium]